MANSFFKGTGLLILIAGAIAIVAFIKWTEEKGVTGTTDIKSRVIRSVKNPRSVSQFKFELLASGGISEVKNRLKNFMGGSYVISLFLDAVDQLDIIPRQCLVLAREAEGKRIWGAQYVIFTTEDDCPETEYFIADPGRVLGWISHEDTQGYTSNNYKYTPSTDPNWGSYDTQVGKWWKFIAIAKGVDLLPADNP
jgi:hypothetical protein